MAAPAPAAAPPVTFEEKPSVHEFETDDEEESDSDGSHAEQPKITLGEEVTLSDDEDEVNTEDELERRAESSTIALNL